MGVHHPTPLRVYPSPLCASAACGHPEAKVRCPTASVTVCEPCTWAGYDPDSDPDFVTPVMWPCPPGRAAETVRLAPPPGGKK